jgi:opacity protein-like surface antigen
MMHKYYFNVNGGMSQLYGDIQDEGNHFTKISNETDLGLGARFGYYVSPIFGIHLQFLKANFKGVKTKSDLEFKSDLMEYHMGTTVNLTNLIFGKKEDRFASVYATAGVGMAFFRSQLMRQSTGNLIEYFGYDELGEKSARESAIVFPMGAGVDFRLAESWYVNLETVLRLTNTDKLDAHESGPKKDAYFYTALGISYNFGKKKRKEVVVPPMEYVEETPVDSLLDTKVDLVYYIPKEVSSYDTFNLKFEIFKGALDGKAELTQVLPIGFNVLDTTIAGAKMQFNNYMLNLNWDEIPKDSVFTVSYTVALDRIYGNLPLTTILYLDRTGKEYKFKTNVWIERSKPPEEEIVQGEVIELPEIIEPAGPSVEFRVQVRAAYKAKIPLQRLANTYHLRDEIKEDYIGNWYRYSVGSFETLQEAKEFRSKIMKDHGVRDAFVVAFVDGVRLNSLSELKDEPAGGKSASSGSTSYNENGTMYRIQILALNKSRVTPEALGEIYDIDKAINEENYDSWHKYTVGEFKTVKEANQLKQQMIDKGIVDAFIVVYKNGERISMSSDL